MKASREALLSLYPRKLVPALLLLLSLTGFPATGAGSVQTTVIQKSETTNLSSQAVYLADPTGRLPAGEVVAGKHDTRFRKLASAPGITASVHWIRLSLTNSDSRDSVFYANITFTDIIHLYETAPSGKIRQEQSGDLFPLSQRPVPVGQMCFVHLYIPRGQTRTVYLRLESSTPITRQFRAAALQQIQLFPRTIFEKRFMASRPLQALFYGACLIMLLYNFFLMIVLRNRDYLFYILYLLSLILFFASNNGYLAEWLFDRYPRPDLYLRFLSTPVLLFFFLLFSRSFLKASVFSPRYSAFSRILLAGLPLSGLLMLAGYWWLGRYLTILIALVVLVLVCMMAIRALRKGYSPAWYFLTANSLLITGGVVFAMQRLLGISATQLPQYGIQVGAVLELALLSLGLADSINLIRKELAEKQLENERLQLQKETELKRLAEEKNRELEQKVFERTSEIVAQKEEIQAQNEQLAANYQKLSAAQDIIGEQNRALLELNEELEVRVKTRTRELELSNTELEEAIAELDRFIYRTAHDIKGPLARLQGLSYVALLDIADENSRSYIQKLYAESVQLNNILSRLSTIYDIKKQVLLPDPIDFQTLIEEIRQQDLTDEKYGDCQLDIAVQESVEFTSDQRLIRFILLNLLENAFKFRKKPDTDPHQVRVRIWDEADSLKITVTDNGTGIDEKDAPYIFDLFSRSARIHKTAGLGLYMTRLGIQRLGGTIRLLPDTSPLTIFEIQLPRQRFIKELPIRLFNEK